jgi:hypothetical protein
MDNDKIDLSEHPSYLASWARADESAGSDESEAVVPGLFGAAWCMLAGTVLAVVLWRLGFRAPVGAAAMSGGAVLLYTRLAGQAPKRGLAPLLLLIGTGMVLTFFAVVVSDGWVTYTILYDLVELPISRIDFIRSMILRHELLENYRWMFVQLLACTAGGAGAALWWVRRRPQDPVVV